MKVRRTNEVVDKLRLIKELQTQMLEMKVKYESLLKQVEDLKSASVVTVETIETKSI